MKQVKINNQEYLVDLNWEMLSGVKSPKKEALDAVKLNEQNDDNSDVGDFAFFIKSSNKNTVVSFFDKPKKIKPAAAYLQAANEKYNQENETSDNWIIIEKTEEGYWICAILQGVPLPGLDIHSDYSEVEEALNTLIEEFEEDDLKNFSFFTTDSYFYKQLQNIVEVNQEDFATLVEGVDVKNKYTRIKGVDIKIIAFLIFLVIVAAAGFYYYHHLKEKRIARQKREQALKAKKKREHMRKIRRKAVENYAKVVQEGYVKLNNEVLKNIEGYSNKSLLHQWANVIGNVSINQHGWDLTHIKCSATQCTVNLKRTAYTNNELLKELHNHININGTKAKYKINISSLKQTHIKPQQVGSSKDLVYKYISNFQDLSIGQYGIQYGVSAPQHITYKIPQINTKSDKMPNLNKVNRGGNQNNQNNKKQHAIVLDNGWHKGTFTIQGKQIKTLYDLYKYLPNRSFAVNTLSFNTKKMSWKLKGHYVYRNKNVHPNPRAIYMKQVNSTKVDKSKVNLNYHFNPFKMSMNSMNQ